MLLLHGFTNTGFSWDPVVSALAQRYPTKAAVAPDIRGHGSMADARPVTLTAVLEQVAAAAPADEFTLVGYSMGGRIALHAALALSDRVRRLVLIGASPGIADAAMRTQRRKADEQLAAELETMTIEQFADRWATTPVLAGQPASARERAREDRLRNTPAGLARALRGLGTGALPSLWERLPELGMPVALVVGERDERFRATALEMAASIPDARVIVVPGTGHAVHMEAPERVADVIGRGVEVGS